MRLFIIVIWVLMSLGGGFAQRVKKMPEYSLNLPAAEYFAGTFANSGDSIAPVGKNKTFQYLNIHDNRPFIDKVFEEAYPFAGAYALVKTHNKYGIIKRDGNYLFKPEFDKFSFFSGLFHSSGIFLNDTSFFDFRKNKLTREPDGIIAEPIAGDIFDYQESGKYGLIFKNGDKSGPIYDSIIKRVQHIAIVKRRGKFGVFNSSGKLLTPFLYTKVVIEQWDGYSFTLCYALKNKGYWHYFNSGKELFKSLYEPIFLQNSLFIVKTVKGFNYLDNAGKLVLNKCYKWVSNSGYMAINFNDEIVIFDKQRQEHKYYTP